MEPKTQKTLTLLMSIMALTISSLSLYFSLTTARDTKNTLVAEKRTEILVTLSKALLLNERLSYRFEQVLQLKPDLVDLLPERVIRVRENILDLDRKLRHIESSFDNYSVKADVLLLEQIRALAESLIQEHEDLLQYINEAMAKFQGHLLPKPIKEQKDSSELNLTTGSSGRTDKSPATEP